jgi:hypothetical protein
MGGVKRSGRVLGVAAVGGLLAVVLLASPAAAAAGTITVSPSVVSVGDAVTISGLVSTAACPISDGVTITSTTGLFPQAGFGPTASRNASGAFSVTYTVPLSTPPGTYLVGLRCGGGNVGVEAKLQVVAQVSEQPARAPQAGLGGASTGGGRAAGSAAQWASGGAVASVIAILLVIVAARRRRRAV